MIHTVKMPPESYKVRHLATVLLGLVHIGLSITYVFNPSRDGQDDRTVVDYVEGLGPIWVTLFGVSGIFLLVSRIMCRHFAVAHVLALSISVFYTGALWASVVIDRPFEFMVEAWAGSALVLAHYALSRWYAVEDT